MNDANHDQDTSQSVIEAATDLDHESTEKEPGARRQDSAGNEALVFGALDKLAQATDQISTQLTEKIEEVHRLFDRDLTAAQEEMGEAQRSALANLRETGRESAEAIEAALAAAATKQETRDSSLRQTVAESIDNILTQQEKQITASMNRIREDLDGSVGRVGQLEERFEEFGRAIEEMREKVESTLQEERDAQTGRFDELRESILEGQQKVVSILAEGMGLFQKEVEDRFESLESRLQEQAEKNQQNNTDVADSLRQEIERFGEQQAERFAEFEQSVKTARESLNEERNQIQEIAEQVREQHSAVAEQVELERQRSEEAENERRLERARRLNNAGVARYHGGEFDRARELFEQSIELDPTSAETFNNLGLTHSEMQQHDEATVAFETAVELDPDLAASYNNLGYILFRQENFEAAVEMYREALGRTPDSSAAHTNLGNALQKLGKTDEAVEAWRKAVEIQPDNERAKRYLERFTGSASPSDDISND